MTLLEKMDRLVYATRLDRIVFMKVQPRSFRWTPLLVIAVSIAGYVLMAERPSVADRQFLIGWLLFYGAFLAAAFLRIFGPRFTGTFGHPLDERELVVKARAHAVSGLVLATFAMLGCFYMASEGVPGLWHPHRLFDWLNLGFGLQAAGLLLPTLIASWLEPRPAADHED
ncbi:MAG TPA: hypothetical protein VFW19_12225 [Allosphingosinicella sp.]|nr:hypothetical protein [Allosphingosinicella sp.]